MTPRTKKATREDGLRRIRRTPSASGDSRGRAGLVAAESWICPGIEQVVEKASEGDHDAADDDAAHHEWIIARADRAHDRVAHTGPGEDLFDEKGTGEKGGKRETNQTDDWEQRIPERVAAQNLALGESLETRGADVIGGKHVEKSGALIPRDHGGREQHQSERGQREMRQTIEEPPPESQILVHRIDRTPDGKDRQPIGKGEQRENREPEIRHRKEKEGDPT